VDHQTPLLITLALGFVAAFALGFVATRLRLPVLVGYLVAGIAIGPFSPGLVADTGVASQLAEIGVILLMFGVGLHFSTDDLLAVRWIAIPGAMGQIAVATAMGAVMTLAWGWSLGGGLVLGLALSVASTVVVLRALEERGAIDSANGRIAIAWLVVEDLAMVLTLVVLPALADLVGGGSATGHVVGEGNLFVLVAVTMGKVAAFLGLVAIAGPRVVPWILQQAARTGSHELFTLAVLAVSLGIAYGSATLFGVSFALGAFCAGVVLSKSELSQRAAEEALPLQHAFAVIFFVSVGMLFDPTIVLRQPLEVLSVLLIILIGKSIVAFAIVQLLGYPVGTALTVSASLAQIGEFSFILAGLGIELGLLPVEGRDLVLAGALFSVTLNPLAFAFIAPAERWVRAQRRVMTRFEPAQMLRLARLQAVLDTNKAGHAKAALKPDELVSRWPVFANLSLVQRAELLALFKPRSAVPGERLIRAGDQAGEAYFISAGAVEVAIGSKKINLGPGDFFGEMALLTGAPRSADVTAIDYCQFLTLDPRDFQHYLQAHPDVHAHIDRIAAERADMNRRQREASTEAPPARSPAKH
jgi:CPA2 family monovalent cation:H+ antiporter-2